MPVPIKPRRSMTLRMSDRYARKVLSLSPIGFWKLSETNGTVAFDTSGNSRNGTYSNVVLAQPGIFDGFATASLDGSTSTINIFSSSLQSAFNGAEGTLFLWAKVSGSGVWSDGTTRQCCILRADASNTVEIRRSSGNNQQQCVYVAGGTGKTVTISSLTTTDWFPIGLTWSKSADQMIAYISGAQTGATQTALGTWAGSLGSGTTRIGSLNSTPLQVWSGGVGLVAVYNYALSPTQMASLQSLF